MVRALCQCADGSRHEPYVRARKAWAMFHHKFSRCCLYQASHSCQQVTSSILPRSADTLRVSTPQRLAETAHCTCHQNQGGARLALPAYKFNFKAPSPINRFRSSCGSLRLYIHRTSKRNREMTCPATVATTCVTCFPPECPTVRVGFR